MRRLLAMMWTGGCHCGAVRYEVSGAAERHLLCHCTDCRRHAGAPMVGWAKYAEGAVRVMRGTPKVYASSESGRRHFCSECGTGLFHTNREDLPGVIDVQSATLDDPDAQRATCWPSPSHNLQKSPVPGADFGFLLLAPAAPLVERLF